MKLSQLLPQRLSQGDLKIKMDSYELTHVRYQRGETCVDFYVEGEGLKMRRDGRALLEDEGVTEQVQELIQEELGLLPHFFAASLEGKKVEESIPDEEEAKKKTASTFFHTQADKTTGDPPSPQAGFYEVPISVSKVKNSPPPSNKPDASSSFFSMGRFGKKDGNLQKTLSEVVCDGQTCLIRGKMVDLSYVPTKSGYLIISFTLEDQEGGALICKAFYKDKEAEEVEGKLKEGNYYEVKGSLKYDSFLKDNSFNVRAIRETKPPRDYDPAEEKRVEFCVHTQMSNMEGLIDAAALKKKLTAWGHPGFGITDFGSVQAYPPFFDAFHDSGIQLLLGYEAKILEDRHHILMNPYEGDLEAVKDCFTVFDIETTGFSRFNDRIIEIGAVRLENGTKVGEFSEFVNPGRPIPERITELTSITDAMVQPADPIEKILPRFFAFCKGSVLVAHNADFDVGFMVENAHRLQLDFQPIAIDTLGLSRALHPEFPNHKLDTISKKLNVPSFHHHRAIDDATATAYAFTTLWKEWSARNRDLKDINTLPSEYPLARHTSYRAMVYVKEQAGLKNLYRLVSEANIRYFYREPGLPRSLYEKYKSGLLIMTGFVGSELFEAVSRRYPEKKLLEIADSYDILCVSPPCFTEKALRSELVEDVSHFQTLVERIISLAEKLGKPCIAVQEPSYLEKRERLARNILINYQRNREMETVERYRYFNTQEMLDQFSWLPEHLAHRLVVETPRELMESFESVRPIPDGTFTPELPGAEEELQELTWKRAHKLYGEELPEIVEKRLNRELDSILSNGYASLYVIAERLVRKSNADGYLVGSRGSVGSSFVANMSGITEVNALLPHYRCPKCKHTEFIEDGSVDSGFDLPPKKCPHCQVEMERNGQNIPFEVFLGFHGDKEPDIDLNFAGVYMPTIHKYTEVLFGEGKVFRAGTISGVQSKTAYGLIKKYMEQKYIPEEDHSISEARIHSLQRMMEGTKRTTGQHAGGLMIVPQNMDILDFCPIQYPADDLNSEVRTTHFSYKNLSGRMLKLDELGHTSPTIIRQLQEMTGIDPLKISFDDPETMEIFSGSASLKAKSEYSNSDDGSLGIPEFGTGFVRGMLKDTKPTSFAELVRISGLSHGTNVWLNNAQDLVRAGTITLSQAICTRDDIMTFLIGKGMDKLHSFKTMEAVRKGRGIPEGMEEEMREHQVPEWYIESCQKIQYMFPKAHAAAYVMMSYRIAWFKVHSAAAFYATYYSQRLSDFCTEYLFESLEAVQSHMKTMQEQADLLGEPVDSAKWTLLEVIEEMLARGYSFHRVDLLKSDAATFRIVDEWTVLPPLSALNDVSEAMAEQIVKERSRGEFISQSDLQKRTGVNKSGMQSLRDYGLLDGLAASNQMSFLAGF